MTRKRRLKAGNLADLQQILWATVLEVERLLDTRPPSNDLVLRSANTLAQLAAAYTRLIETTGLAERIAALEQALGSKR
jgi:hypothetical protein